MNDRQKRFCDEYLRDQNAYQAALRAGYTEQTAKGASKWLKESPKKSNSKKYNPEMCAYIEMRQKQLLEAPAVASAEQVRQFFTAVMMNRVPTVLDDGTTVYTKANVKDRIRAAEDLAKCHGIFSEKITVETTPEDVIEDLEHMVYGDVT